VLQCLSTAGLVKGKTIGIDATTLEANAALRSIVRRDSGESYEEFLTTLAKASGIGTPTRADLARIDRKRKKKGSHDDWMHPHDPDARITKMKDGRTHLAHKAEHAIDLETGASWASLCKVPTRATRRRFRRRCPKPPQRQHRIGAPSLNRVEQRSKCKRQDERAVVAISASVLGATSAAPTSGVPEPNRR
jgi:transposase